MATYDKSQLKERPLFRARFHLGDTNIEKPLLDDDEIQSLIDLHGFSEGVAQCADALATRYAQEPDEYEDATGLKVRWSMKVAQWRATAKTFREGIARSNAALGGAPVSGQTKGPDMTGVRP